MTTTPLENPEIPKIPPHSMEAEQSFLGGVLVENSAMDLAQKIKLTSLDFYNVDHGTIFTAMATLYKKNISIDLVTLGDVTEKDIIDRGGRAYLAELVDLAPPVQSIKHHLEIIKKHSTSRELIVLGEQLNEAAYKAKPDELIKRFENKLMDMRQSTKPEGLRQTTAKDLSNITEGIEAREKVKSNIVGVTTGFYDLDRLTNGFKPGQLIIIAARPGMGKSSMAAQIAEQSREYTALFSLEMSRDEILERQLHMLSRVPSYKISNGFSDGDWSALVRAAGELSESEVSIDDTAGLTVMDVRARCREFSRRLYRDDRALGLVVVDYIQLMDGPGKSRENVVSGISRGLKALAKEFSCPVIALSQLNRNIEGRTEKKPQLSDLRESGAIEQDADIVIFIHRPEAYNDDAPDCQNAEIIIRKQRNGRTGTVNLLWTGSITRFDNKEPN